MAPHCLKANAQQAQYLRPFSTQLSQACQLPLLPFHTRLCRHPLSLVSSYVSFKTPLTHHHSHILLGFCESERGQAWPYFWADGLKCERGSTLWLQGWAQNPSLLLSQFRHKSTIDHGSRRGGGEGGQRDLESETKNMERQDSVLPMQNM